MAVIKQFVNLPTGTTNIHGPTRQLRIAPNEVPAVRPGDRAEWWVEPDGASNTNIFFIPPATRNPTSPSGIAGARVTNTQTTLHATGPNAGHFVNTINLPHVGGDNYVVKVSRRNNRIQFQKSPDTFQTWRKLFYTVFHATPDNLAEFNSVEQTFKDAYSIAFVEWEAVAKIPGLTTQLKVNTTANFTTGNFPFMNGGPNAIMNLRPSGTGHLAHKPFHAALLIARNIFETRNIPGVALNQTNVVGSTHTLFMVHMDAATSLAFIVRANASWTGHPTHDVRNHFTLAARTLAASTVTWDLTTVPGLTHFLATPGHKFNLSFTLVRETQLSGFSFNNFCVARTIVGVTDALQTYTHELAHSLDHAVRSERRFNEAGVSMSDEINVFEHGDMFGGQGPHCSTNATLRPATASERADGATSGQIFDWSGVPGQTLCTMFFASETHVDEFGRFCPACEPRMKRTNMNRAHQLARGWNFFG